MPLARLSATKLNRLSVKGTPPGSGIAGEPSSTASNAIGAVVLLAGERRRQRHVGGDEQRVGLRERAGDDQGVGGDGGAVVESHRPARLSTRADREHERLAANIEVAGEMLCQRVHPTPHEVTGKAVGVGAEAATPFGDDAVAAPAVDAPTELVGADGEELRPVVEHSSADAPCRQTAARRATLVEQHHVVVCDERAGGRQPRQPGSDDHDTHDVILSGGGVDLHDVGRRLNRDRDRGSGEELEQDAVEGAPVLDHEPVGRTGDHHELGAGDPLGELFAVATRVRMS